MKIGQFSKLISEKTICIKPLKELGYCVYRMYMIYKIGLIVFIDLNKMILRENV